VITAALAAKAARRAELRKLLTGRAAPTARTGARANARGFDGGARTPAPRAPESHEDWLIRLLRTHPADRPAYFQPSR
jgi:hypothetical protein